MINDSAHLFSHKKGWSFTFLLLTALFLYGCGGKPTAPIYEPSGRASYPAPVSSEGKVKQASPKADKLLGPAAPLHQKAQALLSKKKYSQAELTIERALRIEPKNGYYWYTLAEIAFFQNQPGRAIQLCLKSKSLASGDTQLIQLNEKLIANSR